MENNNKEELLTEEMLTAAVEEAEAEEFTANAEYEELKAAFMEARIKLALLLSGVNKEKLEECAAMAQRLVETGGYSPEEAAEKLLAELPQYKLADRQLPKFSAESCGSSDGFAAIRSIFAKR